MTRNHDALSPTLTWFSRLRAASGAAWRRFGAWGANLVAALRDPQPQSREDYERELRERVFLPPQP